jgi:hypothetical protein
LARFARLALALIATGAALGACVQTVLLPVPVAPQKERVSYVDEVQPILDRRCVVCHSCYNAPCQLKLSSYEGTDRGGSKLAVYDSARLVSQDPTRLFFDARTTEEWRKKSFHSVTDSRVEGLANDSILLHLLEAKRQAPVSRGEYRPEAADLTCSADSRELGAFLARNPQQGMPFGFPPISDAEYQTLASWLAQGARGPTPAEQKRLTMPSESVAAEIAKWEEFLNRDDPKHAMTARYLYEHYFLAHLRFADAEPVEFYELVRSSTPPGKPVSVIATVRPYDDTDVPRIYYRFRKIHSTIVYKTHMVVDLDDRRLARINELFIEPTWLEQPHQEELGDRDAANPFIIFAQIPPRSRYQFLLDHSEYIIRTFIRGPVCKGQVALNVIHDHFWIFFLDPDADMTLAHPEFLIEQAGHLRLPTEQGSQDAVLKTFSNRYRDRYKEFYKAKVALYQREHPEGFGLDSVWKGRLASDSPILTVYRHFDSASVHRGVIGDLPRTMWAIDYPQLERIYYALVAGFDVFGNLSHQVNVRRYMDYLRIEGELNFLQFMPEPDRLPMLQSWYLGDRAIENVGPEEVRSRRPSRVPFETEHPKRELVEMLVGEYFPLEMDIQFDPINYSWDGKETRMPTSFRTHEDVLNGFRALTAPGTGFIAHVTQSEVNVLLTRVRDYDGEDRSFTIVINRWHDNVNSMFLEASTLDPAKDTIDFVAGSLGSYPNYFFDVAAEDVPDFFDMLENFDGSPTYLAKIDKYGIDRADPGFWEIYDWFQARFQAQRPIDGGLYDLNRYYPHAREAP